MTETGWPLIPREVLPAPVKPARPGHRRSAAAHPDVHPDAGRQLSIFGAETTDPSPADLAGLLAGPGRLGRMGATARVSVAVDAAWRVHVLVAELVSRGLVVSWAPLEERGDTEAGGPVGEVAGPARLVGFEVRTAFSSRLHPLARSWPPAADRLFLDGPRLRLWAAAAGAPRDGGFAFGLGPADGWEIADAALVRAGLAGTVSDVGPAYVISGRKRLARLAELVGERPGAAPATVWPGAAAA